MSGATIYTLTCTVVLIGAFTVMGITDHRNHMAAWREETLTRALHAHDQDINDLMRSAGLPPDQFEAEFREWQARQ